MDKKDEAPLVEPLTRREREVLGLLAEGFTAPEIAAKLTVALSSVKTHIQNLYGKLGVNGKRQAIVRAGELGLLATGAPAAPAVTAPAAPPSPTYHLPVQVTRFFGREAEIEQIRQLLADWRLVTLTGAGGVGKTRLSLRVAEAVAGDYAQGVWLVELAPLSDAGLVAQQAAMVLGVREDMGRPIQDSVVSFLRNRSVLLVLDNCEHLIEACARLAEALLRACPRVTLLASSREPLGVGGEANYLVPSLPVPPAGQDLTPELAAEYEAVRLFADRARLALPGYQVAAHNAAAVTRICRRLDGIPLAIEMAAARVKVLSAGQIADRLDAAFDVLTSQNRTALPRHQTLRATMDWSYALLTDEERRLLRRLAVFAGGWTLEAAEAVCAEEESEKSQVLDVLASLVAKSMVVAERQQGEEVRYHLLEMVRQFAQEKADEAGESDRLRRRHRDYFYMLAETTWRALPRERHIRMKQLFAEPDNVRLALEWSFSEAAGVEAGPALLISLCASWPLSVSEADEWCSKGAAWCQAHPEISPLLEAQVLRCVSGAVANYDLPRGVALSEQAVEMCRRLGPEAQEILMQTLVHQAEIRASLDEANEVECALAEFLEAENILETLGPDRMPAERAKRLKAFLQEQYARLASKQGRHADAKWHAAESIRINQVVGDRWAERGLLALGEACVRLGEFDQARVHYLAAQKIQDDLDTYLARQVEPDRPRQFADRTAQSNIKCCLGLVELRLGNVEAAGEYCRASIRAALEGSHNAFLANALGLAAGVAAAQGRRERAARLSGASLELFTSSGRKPWEDFSLDALFPGWRGGPDAAALQAAFEQGLALRAEEAAALALGDQQTSRA